MGDTSKYAEILVLSTAFFKLTWGRFGMVSNGISFKSAALIALYTTSLITAEFSSIDADSCQSA